MATSEDRSNIASNGTRLRAPLASPAVSMLAISLLASLTIDGASAAQKPQPAPNPQSVCAALAKLKLPQTTITSAMVVPAGPFSQVPVLDPYAAEGTTSPLPTCSSNIASPQLPAFCRVTAGISTPGALEPINIEVWLPLQNWNGKFVGIGNHGAAGEIEYGDMGPHLVRGYAVATTDTGHAGANATTWMQNPQQIINYGYNGVHEMTVKAKAIVTAAYDRPPRYSYWDGCSTGGKEGLTEAQRYPDDYDGINIAGSANNAQIHNREQYVWNAQVTFGNAATPLGPAQTALVNSAALKACDGLDGVVDGVIDNPLTCPFKVASLLCAQNQDPSTCLTQAQVTAVEKVYQGPRNPVTGKSIYPGYSPGTELGWGSNTTGPVPSTAQNFFKFMVYNDPNWNYQTFNFSSDVAFTDAKFAVTLDAVNPDLRAFKRRGGKILQSHLWSSTTHPARRSVEWYSQVVSFMNVHDEGTRGDDRQGHLDIRDFLHEATQGDNHRYPGALNIGDFRATQHFYRFFLAPGGSGSKGPGAFDSLPYLERWVEEGIPPTSILASHVTNGVVDRTRPLCLYPAFAEYKGSGSTDDAANFKCSEPHQVPNYFLQDGLQPEPLPPSPQDQH
ncbi:MAG TPA: tannase/feruloyl esterase family alpha/beta hydrolase [Pseudolabrys sp.]|jgi:feruloyl esterase|nr:tannase/feruloyl esterase family alpha/beta hydrolase [Pseudolabrys sp.]